MFFHRKEDMIPVEVKNRTRATGSTLLNSSAVRPVS